MYRSIIFPLLSRVEAEQAHHRTLDWLERVQDMRLGQWLLRLIAGRISLCPVTVMGLTFPNVLGVAAGFDKDGRVVRGLAELGFGHIEVGTLTPRPQVGNPRPRLFRIPRDGALINRLGFPNEGVASAVPRLAGSRRLRGEARLGVSLGKQKETPLDQAVGDYIEVMRAVYPYADFLSVNVSSPNTPGLRQLQGSRYLSALLRELQGEGKFLAESLGISRRPLLLKIAPDLERRELDAILEAALQNAIDGIIATNTTVSRDGLADPRRHEAGGLSGKPLRERSTRMIATIAEQTKGALPLVGVGGVTSAADVREKLDAGASLVQLYTGLVYGGPGVAGRILRRLHQQESPA